MKKLTLEDYKKQISDALSTVGIDGEEFLEELTSKQSDLIMISYLRVLEKNGEKVKAFESNNWKKEIGLSNKLSNVLKRNNMDTFLNFITISPKDFMKLRNIGDKGFDEFVLARQKAGYPVAFLRSGLGITEVAYKKLICAGITSIDQLQKLSDKELKEIYRNNLKMAEEVKIAINSLNFSELFIKYYN